MNDAGLHHTGDDPAKVARNDATIEHVVDIDAPLEIVYALWTTADGLARWWGRALALEATPGGPIHVDLGQPVMVGEFITLEPPHHIVFTFGWSSATPDGDLAPCSTTVDVTITPTSTGSRLTLRHHGLPRAHHASHARGWQHFLGRMAAATPGANDAG